MTIFLELIISREQPVNALSANTIYSDKIANKTNVEVVMLVNIRIIYTIVRNFHVEPIFENEHTRKNFDILNTVM